MCNGVCYGFVCFFLFACLDAKNSFYCFISFIVCAVVDMVAIFAVLQIFLLYILLCINIALFGCWFVCIWLCIDYFVSAKNGILYAILAKKVLKTAEICGF